MQDFVRGLTPKRDGGTERWVQMHKRKGGDIHGGMKGIVEFWREMLFKLPCGWEIRFFKMGKCQGKW
jgi:hypothetical protein